MKKTNISALLIVLALVTLALPSVSSAGDFVDNGDIGHIITGPVIRTVIPEGLVPTLEVYEQAIYSKRKRLITFVLKVQNNSLETIKFNPNRSSVYVRLPRPKSDEEGVDPTDLFPPYVNLQLSLQGQLIRHNAVTVLAVGHHKMERTLGGFIAPVEIYLQSELPVCTASIPPECLAELVAYRWLTEGYVPPNRSTEVDSREILAALNDVNSNVVSTHAVVQENQDWLERIYRILRSHPWFRRRAVADRPKVSVAPTPAVAASAKR